MKTPDYAETIPADDHQRTVASPSKFAPGVWVHKRVQLCPGCGNDIIDISHGQYRECRCGLRMKLHGNALEIWR